LAIADVSEMGDSGGGEVAGVSGGVEVSGEQDVGAESAAETSDEPGANGTEPGENGPAETGPDEDPVDADADAEPPDSNTAGGGNGDEIAGDVGEDAEPSGDTAAEAESAAETDTQRLRPMPAQEGMRLFRVFGPNEGTGVTRTLLIEGEDGTLVDKSGSQPFGEFELSSWTTIDPRLSPDLRADLGLPNENPARFIVEGILLNPENVYEVRAALKADGQKGGWPEYRIRDAEIAIQVTGVAGVNEPSTHGPGDYKPRKKGG
jgi:hypothetical protein